MIGNWEERQGKLPTREWEKSEEARQIWNIQYRITKTRECGGVECGVLSVGLDFSYSCNQLNQNWKAIIMIAKNIIIP